MKTVILMSVCCFLAGCLTVVQETPSVKNQLFEEKEQLTNIQHVQKGMSQQEVLYTMGDHVLIGYKYIDGETGIYESIALENPYRVEVLTSGSEEYKVHYYFTSIVKPDGVVTEEELTPLVFDHQGYVAGKGKDFLFALESKIKSSRL